MLAGTSASSGFRLEMERITSRRSAKTAASATSSASRTNSCVNPSSHDCTPATNSTVTMSTSQSSANSDARSLVSRPPSARSTGAVRKLAATVGRPTKNTPRQASSSGYAESKATIPVTAASVSASARLEYHLGTRKMYRDSPARLLCVVVTGLVTTSI